MSEAQLASFARVPFSHDTLLSLLADYRRPNDKIADWLRQGVLVSLKRGLYVRGQDLSGNGLCLPLLANRLYGPSCVSLDYALAWHGLIPERVRELTSVCMRRSRVIDNDFGRFSYTRLPAGIYALGIEQVRESDRETFLIASPAKALCDKVLLTRYLRVTTRDGMRRFVLDDLRIDGEALLGLDLDVVRGYASSGHKPAQMAALLGMLEAMQ
ncbi:hypothetical protein [Castellaniella sp.]|uniref:type IV toxin-antitoxin system AbiEi family antitoxin domain-containing protein n=1 Tax=Castellaniella sp. TaxID=1955812 RepID=UPI002AFF21D4|nr:hypothetical protein [Castellaniella sp.]